MDIHSMIHSSSCGEDDEPVVKSPPAKPHSFWSGSTSKDGGKGPHDSVARPKAHDSTPTSPSLNPTKLHALPPQHQYHQEQPQSQHGQESEPAQLGPQSSRKASPRQLAHPNTSNHTMDRAPLLAPPHPMQYPRLAPSPDPRTASSVNGVSGPRPLSPIQASPMGSMEAGAPMAMPTSYYPSRHHPYARDPPHFVPHQPNHGPSYPPHFPAPTPPTGEPIEHGPAGPRLHPPVHPISSPYPLPQGPHSAPVRSMQHRASIPPRNAISTSTTPVSPHPLAGDAFGNQTHAPLHRSSTSSSGSPQDPTAPSTAPLAPKRTKARRQSHILAEQRRREVIHAGFEDLRHALRSNASQANILVMASRRIGQLETALEHIREGACPNCRAGVDNILGRVDLHNTENPSPTSTVSAAVTAGSAGDATSNHPGHQ